MQELQKTSEEEPAHPEKISNYLPADSSIDAGLLVLEMITPYGETWIQQTSLIFAAAPKATSGFSKNKRAPRCGNAYKNSANAAISKFHDRHYSQTRSVSFLVVGNGY